MFNKESIEKQKLIDVVLKLLDKDEHYVDNAKVNKVLPIEITTRTAVSSEYYHDIQFNKIGTKAYQYGGRNYDRIIKFVDPENFAKDSENRAIKIDIGGRYEFWVTKAWEKEILEVVATSEPEVADNCISLFSKGFFKNDYLYNYDVIKRTSVWSYQISYNDVYQNKCLVETEITENQFNMLLEIYDRNIDKLKRQKELSIEENGLKFLDELSKI